MGNKTKVAEVGKKTTNLGYFGKWYFDKEKIEKWSD